MFVANHRFRNESQQDNRNGGNLGCGASTSRGRWMKAAVWPAGIWTSSCDRAAILPIGTPAANSRSTGAVSTASGPDQIAV